MGESAGAGSPLFFRCLKCRQSGRANPTGGAQRVELTGATKRRTNHRVALGVRSSQISRQYRCLDCGYLGWSNHKDLERKEVHEHAT